MMYMDDRPLGKNEFLKKCQKTEADKYSLFKKKRHFSLQESQNLQPTLTLLG